MIINTKETKNKNNITNFIIKLNINDNIIGYINTIIKNNICTITSFIIKEEYRNNGYGTFLLKKIIRYCLKNNIKKIELDDMSDNFNKENNIYIKNGFRYIENGFPEMILLFNNFNNLTI